jgi:hypothetical protein
MRFRLIPRFLQTSWYLRPLLETPIEVPASLLGVWGYLILARAWEAHDDWRDWLGRWLGWCWIGLMLLPPISRWRLRGGSGISQSMSW